MINWRDYAQATRVDHFAWWCKEHCVQSIDRFAGLPLGLEAWQVQMMGEALAEVDEGESYWSTVVLVVPKKNGKTSLLAAYGLYHLVEDEGTPEILLAAATDKQAGRLFETAVRFVRSDPWLSARLVVREHEGQIARSDGFGYLWRFSADGGAASGYGPSLIVADELKDWSTPRRRRAWGDIASAGQMIRQQMHVFVISTAGEPEERVAGLLGQLIDGNELEGEVERVHRALTVSRNHRGRTLVYNYDARTHDPFDLEALKAANPASWVTGERLAELAASPSLTSGRFLQLHGCVWTASEAAFIDLEAWRQLSRPARLEPGEEITLGFRGGDVCALVACRRSDGTLFTVAVWEPTTDGLVDAEDVDDAVQAMVRDQRVAALYATATPEWSTMVDGWRQLLGKRRVIDLDVARPTSRVAEVTQRFRADALRGRLHHDGDRRLAAHVAAARLGRARNLPYLVPDVRHGSPISACQAAVVAWEAHAISDPATGQRRGYAFY